MITGDNILTAIAVSNKLDFGPHSALTLTTEDGKAFNWLDHDEKQSPATITSSALRTLAKSHTLCIIGPTIEKMIKNTPLDIQKIVY
jgi:magnesium-transporting ATPase (P-type)